MDSKKFYAKKVDSFRMRAIGRTVWAGLYEKKQRVKRMQGLDKVIGFDIHFTFHDSFD